MSRVTPRRPSGFQEYLPSDQIEFNRLLGIIRRTYESYGYAPLDTPDIELSEVLLAKGGGETEQEVYRFTRQGSDKDLTLRYDLTVPLARYVAEHESDLVFPFRRYHIGKVHRAERAQAGRFREFYQCDVDVIGSESPLVDAEFPAIINSIFSQFDCGEFVIRINNRQILSGLFAELGVQSLATDILRAIDKTEKIGTDAVYELLLKAGVAKAVAAKIIDFIAVSGTNDEILAQLKSNGMNDDAYIRGVVSLEAVLLAVRMMGVPEHRIQIDLRIVRGLDYYTGTVYETQLVDFPSIGSVCSGGRYDNLASHYTKTNLVGVGVSIGLSRLYYALKEVGAINAGRHSPADIVVLPVTMQQRDDAIRIAAELREAGLPTLLYTENDAVGKKLRYVSRMGMRYAILIGDKEAADGTVTIKDMEQRTESTVSLDDARHHLHQQLDTLIS